jgi:hypothetical protein
MQADFRMPATGEGWRHYKGDIYTIVGVAVHSETHQPMVVYTPWGWTLAQLPPLYVRPLEVFLQMVPQSKIATNLVPRFRFERKAGNDHKCPFIPHSKKKARR